MDQEVAYASVMARLRSRYEEKRKKRPEGSVEKKILDRSMRLQARIGDFESNDPSVRRNAYAKFGNTLALYSDLFLGGQGEPSNEQLSRALNRIISFSNPPSSEELSIQSEYLFSITSSNPNSYKEKAIKFLKERCQEETMVFLFRMARETAAKPFDSDKELRQIRAVNHLLAGDHVAMDTGDGKTSVVLPIFSITRSLVDAEKVGMYPPLIMSSADNTMTSDLKSKTVAYRTALTNALQKIVENRPQLGKSITAKLAMLPEYMELPDDKTGAETIEGYFSQKPPPLIWMSANGVNIGFQPHDQAVFSATDVHMEFSDELQRSAPGKSKIEIQKDLAALIKTRLPVYAFDEVHLLWEASYIQRHNGRKKEGKMKVIHKEGVQAGQINYYLTMRLAHETLLRGKDNIARYTEARGQRYYLTEQGRKRLSELRKTMVADLKAYLADHKKSTPLIRKMLRIIREEIEPACKFDGSYKRNELLENMLDVWGGKGQKKLEAEGWSRETILYPDRGMVDRLSMQDQFLSSTFEDYLRAITAVDKGVDYISPDKVRDRLRGILLPNRQFTGMMPFQLNLSEGNFTGVDESGIENRMNFPTWVASMVQGNVVGVSNDLFYTDPVTGKRELSVLGKMLEKHTQGYVVDLAPKKDGEWEPYFPDPDILRSKKDLAKKIYRDIDSRIGKPGWRQEMVVCWDEEMGNRLYNDLLKTKKRVAFINAELSDEQADIFHKQFANGEIDFLVTTGRKSFGADFKNQSGQFTDFRVNIINPETIFQVAQAFGRRRLDKSANDFSMYFDESSLMFLGSILSEKTKQSEAPITYLMEKLLKQQNSNFDELTELVNKALQKEGAPPINDEEKARLAEMVVDVLRKNQRQVSTNWERVMDQEIRFIEQLAPEIADKKRRIFENALRDENSPVRTVITDEVKREIKNRKLGDLPQKFVNGLIIGAMQSSTEIFSGLESSIYQDFSDEMSRVHEVPSIVATTEQTRDSYLIDRFRERVDAGYEATWKEEVGNGNGHYIQHILRDQVKRYINIAAEVIGFMDNELKTRGKSIEDVENYSVLFSPLFFPTTDPNKRPLPFGLSMRSVKATHGQTIMHYSPQPGQDTRYIFAGGLIRQVDEDDYEARLAALNNLREGAYNDLKKEGYPVIDLFYPGKSTRFIRLVMKQPEEVIVQENEREELLG